MRPRLLQLLTGSLAGRRRSAPGFPAGTGPEPARRRRPNGQALAEFALIIPVFMAILGGIIQYGLILWGENTVTQIVRETGRWEAAQQTCSNSAAVITTANSVAGASDLIGYTANSWTATQVSVTFTACPPVPTTLTNGTAAYVTIAITTKVPVFFPLVPGNGQISSSAQFRIEPAPQ